MNLIDMILKYYGVVLFVIDGVLLLDYGENRFFQSRNKSIIEGILMIILTIILIYNLITIQTIKEKTQIYQIPNTQEFYSIDNVSGSGFLFSETDEKSIIEYYDGKEIKRIKVDIEDVDILYDVENSNHNYVLSIYEKINGMGDKNLVKIEIHLQQGKK